MQSFFIRGYSLEPDFKDKDEVIIEKRSEYKPGDIVILELPKYGKVIKKITQIEGDEFPEEGCLKEWKLHYKVIPKDYVIVMGNAINSIDSRKFGPVHINLIIGAANKINA